MRGCPTARRSCREDEVAMTLFLIEYRGDGAGIKQVLHFLKIRSEIRGPNFHGPSFCISFKTRRTSRPYAVVFPVCAVSLVRRALGRLAVVAVMAMVLTNLRWNCTPSLWAEEPSHVRP